MNGLDATILIVLALFTLLGIYWGLIRQVLSIVGLIVGIAVAGRYGPDVAGWLTSFTNSDALAGWVGFIIVLIGVSAAASIIASALRLFVGLLFLGWLDHLLGAVLGAVQAVIACGIVLALSLIYPQPGITEAISSSQLAAPFLQVGSVVAALLPAQLQQVLQAALR